MIVRPASLLASSLLLLLIAVTGLVERTAFAYDLVSNGSFEGSTAGWSAMQANLRTTTDVPAPFGTHVAEVTLTASGTPFRLEQESGAWLGAGTYAFAARVLRSGSATGVFAMLIFSAPEGKVIQTPFATEDEGGWTTIATSFATAGGYQLERISIRGSGSAGDVVYVDDVRLDGATPVAPEPSSTPLPGTMPGAVLTTATRTATSTKTASPTRSPTVTPVPSNTPTGIGYPLLNGDFEQIDGAGAPLVWDTYGGDAASVTEPRHGGGRSARFVSSTESTKWLHQVVRVEGGTHYEFATWMLHDDPGVSAAFLRISWYASEDGSGEAITTADSAERLVAPLSGYRYLTTGAALAPTPALSARVRVMLAPASSAPAAIYVDDATFGVAAPPEPSAAATVAVAVGIDQPEQAVLASAVTNRTGPTSHARFGSLGTLVINEVLYDADGPGDDAEAEWVELYNYGLAPVTLAGWSLADASGSDVFPELSLAPRGYAIVAASDAFHQRYTDYTGPLAVLRTRIGNALGNDGDRLTLRDATGAVIDAVSWGRDRSALDPAVTDVPEGHSIERRVPGADTDIADDFIDNEAPSPGMPYAPPGDLPPSRAGRVELIEASDGALAPWAWAFFGAAGAALGVACISWLAPSIRARLTRAS